MSKEFEQISIKPGFMKHNGGVLFKNISDTEYHEQTLQLFGTGGFQGWGAPQTWGLEFMAEF